MPPEKQAKEEAVQEVVTDTAEEENFDAAFGRIADENESETGEDSDQEESAPAPVSEDDTSDADDESDAEDDEEEVVAEDDEEDEEDDEPAATTSDDEILSRFAELVRAQEGKAPAKKEAPAEQQQKEEAPAAYEPPEIYTDEEKEFLTEYERDWPDVAKAEALRRKSEYRELVGFVFSQIASEFQPIMEAVQSMSEKTHVTELKTKITDYDTIRENVVEWVDGQPEYLQTAYKHVIERGTVDEVADLVDRYKREAGVLQTAPAKKKPETELPTKTKKAVASLAPVSSKRSAVTVEDDPSDFDGAFRSFAEKLEAR